MTNRKIRATAIERFWPKVVRNNTNDCWPWVGNKVSGGYGRLWVPTIRKTGKIPATHFSFLLAYGYLEPGMDMMHSCDNPCCVNPRHLNWGTRKENMVDCSKKGRANNGGVAQFKHPRIKFTPESVRAVKAALDAGKAIRAIAKETGLNRKSIQKIHRGQWTV